MPRLKLKSLECIETEDSGNDEAYLRVKGVTVWGSSINSGQTADLEGIAMIPFSYRARIALYDEDWPDADDFLGSTYALRNQLGQGDVEYHFREDDAHYLLTYEVLS